MTLKRFSIREIALPFEIRKVLPLTLFPVTDILFPEKPSSIVGSEALLFSYKITLNALKAYLNGQYIELDALTTTNCCHGMSLFTRSLLLETHQLDLKSVLHEGENQIRSLEMNTSASECAWYLPMQIIDLARLYILSQIKEKDPVRRWKTIFEKLKQISSIGTKLCRRISSDLQTYFSNKMAESYYSHFQNLNKKMVISGAPVGMWGKYLHPDFIRADRRGRKYAPCLFSMQVSLAHLIQSKATVALVNDLRCSEGKIKGRYLQLFKGDGHSQFVPISSSEIMDGDLDERMPVVIFGGCSYSDDLNEESFEFLISPWLSRLSQLILACDTKYPQFPAVRDDPNFDSSPIVPEEERLQKIISHHRKIPGVCARDASFFCLAHIYTASMKQVLSVLNKEEEEALPYSFLPEIARPPHLQK